MKKLLLPLLVAFIVMGCNADTKSEAFVREILHQQGTIDDDIKSITSEPSDSVISDIYAACLSNALARGSAQYSNGEISKKEFEKILDEYILGADDIGKTWRYAIVVNDSLRKLDKYKNYWRKVELVKIEFKSGATKQCRVAFDNQGTPVYTEAQWENEVMKKYDTIFQNALDLLYGI